MSVYDKELVINGKAVRSPEQQVYKNMKDIEALQETIKPEYNTSAELTSSSVSVALSTTNAPSGTTEGWIITQDGLKFKITGGDETNLLLEFYCNIKGPQGEQGPSGAELEIDDNGTSATKVWSSQKVAEELSGVGQQLYEHHIKMVYSQTGQPAYNISFKITNDNLNALTITDVKNYLVSKGCNSRDNSLDANGQFVRTTGANDYHYICQGVYVDSDNFYMWGTRIGETSTAISDISKYENGLSDLKDKVIPL